MFKTLKDKYRVWSANQDLKNVFRTLNKNAIEYGHGVTMFYEGAFSIVIYTSNPDILEGIRKLVEPIAGRAEQSDFE